MLVSWRFCSVTGGGVTGAGPYIVTVSGYSVSASLPHGGLLSMRAKTGAGAATDAAGLALVVVGPAAAYTIGAFRDQCS